MEGVTAGCSKEGAGPVVQSALPWDDFRAGLRGYTPRGGSSLGDSPEGRNNVAGLGNCK